MMTLKMAIYLVTHNQNKVREFKHILEPEIAVHHIDLEYPEIRAASNAEVSKDAAQKLSEKLKMAVVVEDSGLFISALNGFPGTYSAAVHKCIGLVGLLKLMEGVQNRECFYRSAVGYGEQGKEPVVFVGQEKGTISQTVRGSFGFGHDPIFIPEGAVTTYGEMPDVFSKKQFRRNAIVQLKKYLIRERV